jgi:nitrite reductase/ring-hydroxylating ferredoxin subunit/uncharacterized membrane protein
LSCHYEGENIMLARYVDNLLTQEALQKPAEMVAGALHKAILDGGKPVRQAVDLLHGSWLGHPLHPVLTDVVVGAWGMAGLLDLIGGRRSRKAADTLTEVGAISAVPTAVTGLADFSGIKKSAAGAGLSHALMNTIALVFYLFSIRARRKGQRRQGVFLSAFGLGVATMSAYVGGHLVFSKKVGVDHSEAPADLPEWRPVLDADDLRAGSPKRITVDGTDIALFRRGNQVYAVNAVCPHAGGPLDEGQVEGETVQCPWHDSVFDLADGSIVHGPTAFPVACYEARRRNGQIEIRSRQPEAAEGQEAEEEAPEPAYA